MFGTLLHSHTVGIFYDFLNLHFNFKNKFNIILYIGKGIWIEHSRGGVQLPNIDSNYNYDFNFQV